MSLRRCAAIDTAMLFPELLEALLTLLRGLDENDWERPTVCDGWSVKDVALHLLGGEVGILSRRRDDFTAGDVEIASWRDLVSFIDGLNRDWIAATRRLSPRLLVDLLDHLGRQSCEHFAALEPEAPGDVVAWVDEAPAPIWMELAREYTERWHHQQQIRDAVGREGMRGRRHLAPVLDAFVRALPRAYAGVPAGEGSAVTLSVEGESGGDWTVRREAGTWQLYAGAPETPAATLVLPQDAAWRLFCKAIPRAKAGQLVRVEGDAELARHALSAIAIIG